MRLEHYPQKKLEKEILKIVSKHLDLKKYKVFFFGSRVRGDNFEKADIDIGIEGSKEVPAKAFLNIQDDLEKIPFLYKIDFVDFKTVSEKFKKEALKHIEKIK